MNKGKESDWFSKINGPRESLPAVKKPPIKVGISKEDEIKIGLEMVPMYRHAEMELTQQFDKIKGVRDEINAFKEEHNIKLKYVQPVHTTHFMNRKISKQEMAVDYQQINKTRFSKFTSQSQTRPEKQPSLNKDLKDITEKPADSRLSNKAS